VCGSRKIFFETEDLFALIVPTGLQFTLLLVRSVFVSARRTFPSSGLSSFWSRVCERKTPMARRPIALLVACGLTSLAMLVAAILPIELSAASKVAKKPIKNPKFDPSAEQVDLFEAMDAKQISVRLIPKDAKGGTVLIENKTDKPLTV